MVRAALAFTRVLFFHSHLRHPNHKQVLNNKDHNKDDDKGEADDRVHLAVGISPDYRLIRKFVKGQFSESEAYKDSEMQSHFLMERYIEAFRKNSVHKFPLDQFHTQA